MNKEFGYNWNQIWMVILVLPIVGAYIGWREGDVSRPDVIILLIVGVYMMGRNALPLCKIFITGSDIEVSFLFPFRKGGHFQHNQIKSYQELAIQRKGKRIPIAGYLQPKNGSQMLIIGGGVKDFGELNSLLLELYPRPKITEPKDQPNPHTSGPVV